MSRTRSRPMLKGSSGTAAAAVLAVAPAAVGSGHGHAETHGHGPGPGGHASILQALEGCRAVISKGMGRRLYDDLRAAGIEAFIVDETDADRALEQYLRDALIDHPDKSCDHSSGGDNPEE
ncbi:MAG: NifB/NifX family molybdenum-iron cluster-binding protein [bacterium]